MVAFVALPGGGARAGSVLTWDVNAAAGIQGGSGIWNTSAANWNDGANRIQWSNTRGDTAAFAGTPVGTIGFTSSLTAAGLEFDAAGYTLGSVSSPALTLTSGSVAANADAVIAAPLSTPAGFTKSGAGVLTLQSSNTFRGVVAVMGGTLSFTTEAQLGASSNAIELGGGALRYAGSSALTFASARKLTVDASGGSIELSNGALSMLTAGQLQGAGTLTKLGTRTLTIGGANTGFTGALEVDAGAVLLQNAAALNARPVTLAGGSLLLRGDESTAFGDDLSVTGDAAVNMDWQTIHGNAQGNLGLGNLNVSDGVTLTLSGTNHRFASVQDAQLAGALQVNGTGLLVNGSLTGSGGITFGPLVQVPELFGSGLLFAGGGTRTFANPLASDDAVVVGVGTATTITYQGHWGGGDANAGSTVVLRDGGHFVMGAGAHVNTLAADLTNVRPFVVTGDGTFEIDAGMVADRTAGGTVADGFAGLELRDATLLTHSTQSLPVVVKNDGFGATHRAGSIRFSGTGGSEWRVATANQQFDGGVKFASSATILAEKDLTHTGTVAGKFDGQFQIASGDAVLTKQGAGWLNLSQSQGYAPGSRIVVREGGVRFNTDPGAGWYEGNYARGTEGNVLAAPTPAGTLTVQVGGAAGPAVEFAAAVSRIDNLHVDAGGKAKVLASPQAGERTLLVRSIDVEAGGQLDVTDNRLVVDYDAAASPIADVAALIRDGFNASGAHWQGSGINSSVAAANVGMGLGYAEASDVLAISGTQSALFGDAPVDASSVLVRFTRIGDADLDGVVTFADFQRLEEGLGKPGRGWSGGDFNYDGSVDDADYRVFYVNYSLGLSADGSVVGVLPEPVGAGMILPVAAMALARRRRRRGRP
jgi:autotransporter-associated beta strand protein